MNKEKRLSNARSRLLGWYSLSGRHELPWRTTVSPYAVLVSEFMLQQTTVATVKARFLDWMTRFPNLHSLAKATEEEVLSAWQGLGYYSRARRLHAAAKTIMNRHGGVIPDQQNLLLSLPGIGPYTATAIKAFAYDQHALVLDTNIIRVLARWANLELPINIAGGKKALEKIAHAFYPRDGCRIVASALMDLGATLCTSGNPRCQECPLQSTCQAKEPSLLPRKSPRPVTLKRSETRLCFYHDELLYLQQSQGPHWRGLWILPEIGEIKARGLPLAKLIYPITRYKVTMTVYRTDAMIPSYLRGFPREDLASIPIPSPHLRAIEMIFSNLIRTTKAVEKTHSAIAK